MISFYSVYSLETHSGADAQRDLWIDSVVLDFVVKVHFGGSRSFAPMCLCPQRPPELPALRSNRAA